MAAATKPYPPPSGAHENCSLCDDHFYSVEVQQRITQSIYTSVSDTEADRTLRYLLTDTKQKLNHVKGILHSHGDLVLVRWRKKYNQEKRAELLKKASDYFFGHNYEAVTDANEDPWRVVTTSKVLAKWLEPEKFSQDSMRLLSLLHTRTMYEPQQWAAFDTRLSWEAFLPDCDNYYYFNSNAVIMHGEQYGQLTTFDANSAHSWETVGYPRAWVTFVAQYKIANLLSSAVDLLGVKRIPQHRRPSALESLHHPEFSPPLACNPNALLEKARNHLNLLVDEIELMQTSPEHMYKHVSDVKACTVYDDDGEDTRKSEEQLWTKAARELALSWTNEIFIWQRIVIECENLKKELSDSGCTVMTGTRLTRKADAAVRCFGVLLRGLLMQSSAEWANYLLTIVALRDLFSRCASRDKALGVPVHSRVYHPAKEWDPSERSNRVAMNAVMIYNVVMRGTCANTARWVYRLKKQLEGIKYNKCVENWMSGLALLDEMYTSWRWRQTIDHHDPWDKMAQDVDIRSRDFVPVDFDEDSKEMQELQCVSTGDRMSGKLLRDFYEVPPPQGVKNLTWLKEMTESRGRLARFWDCVRASWKVREAKANRSEAFTTLMLAHLSFDMAPKYLGEVKEERERIEGEVRRLKVLRQEQQKGTPFVQQEWDLGRSGDDVAVRRNVTKKTNAARQIALLEDAMQRLHIVGDPTASANVVSSKSKSALRISVKQDTLSIISKMFPKGTDGSSSVRWENFVKALKDAGFVATQGAGSAMSFSNEHGSVSFHKPHPEPDVDAIRLRACGKRLNKWFGWKHETFVLRPKDGEELAAGAEAA